MGTTIHEFDTRIRNRLRSYSQKEKEFWSFRSRSARRNMHECFQYPGMMVPQMQGELISTIMEIVPETKSVYEPFAGSGTVMIESMKRGLDFVGQDINPLAVLLCRAKSGPFYEEALRTRILDFISLIRRDKGVRVEAAFPGLKKWFRQDVAIELSKIRRAIRKEQYLWCRRFYWMALAETVRLTSNSRTSTYKLHIRTREEIRGRNTPVVDVFLTALHRNLVGFSSQRQLLKDNGQLSKGRYKGSVVIRLTDSSIAAPTQKEGELQDLLVTSPPYGDNKTTIPYGQHSFLPLQWIDLDDIETGLDESLISTTHEIDSRSLGGRLRHANCISDLLERSPNLRMTIARLKDAPSDRTARVAAFWRDLDRSLEPICKRLKPNAYMIWTVGNRNVDGRPVPMDRILSELLKTNNAVLIEMVSRRIPNKRMAVKNNVSQTVNTETILIFRKGP